MKTIAVSNGDIQLDSGKISFVTGTNKLVQDIGRWLREPLGTGFTTPGFGSTLPGIVGLTQSDGMTVVVQNEIMRVLEVYQAQQIQNIQKAQSRAELANWNKNEVIQTIVSIDVEPYNDSMYAYVVLETLGGSVVNLNLSLDRDGVGVQNG